MNDKIFNAADKFFLNAKNPFTLDEFYKSVKTAGKITKSECSEILNSVNFILPFDSKHFVTRSGFFTGKLFSFMPTREEIKKGKIILGSRCMPFINPEIHPDSISLYGDDGKIETSKTEFSMNLALDLFALFGDGYVISYLLNDSANSKHTIKTIQYGLPSAINLTSWDLNQICKNQKIRYGDRILCYVTNWEKSRIHVELLKTDCALRQITESDIERSSWYEVFETGLLDLFDEVGPLSTIEEQLAYLYIRHSDELCIKNCGSNEDFMAHTRKIRIAQYGVESRIWRTKEEIPYAGKWNESVTSESLLYEMMKFFSPDITDLFVRDSLYIEGCSGKPETGSDIVKRILPASLELSESEKELIAASLNSRREFLGKNYNVFFDDDMVTFRRRSLELFSEMTDLLCAIGTSKIDIHEFPSQEMIVLMQMFGQNIRILYELGESNFRETSYTKELDYSLAGMQETFEDIRISLVETLETKSFNSILLKKH